MIFRLLFASFLILQLLRACTESRSCPLHDLHPAFMTQRKIARNFPRANPECRERSFPRAPLNVCIFRWVMCEIFMRDPSFIPRTWVPQRAAVIRLYRCKENRKAGVFARRKFSKMRLRSASSSVYLKNWNNSVDGTSLVLSPSICAEK